MIKRRNLSTPKVLHSFEDEAIAIPTSPEDLPQEDQIKWIESMSHQTLKQITLVLLTDIKNIGDKFGAVATSKVDIAKESLLTKIPQDEQEENTDGRV